MKPLDHEAIKLVKEVVDRNVGFYFIKDSAGKKCKIDRKFADIIAFGKHLAEREKNGDKEYEGIAISLLLRWMRKSSKQLKTPVEIWDQNNLFKKEPDKVIVIGNEVKIKNG